MKKLRGLLCVLFFAVSLAVLSLPVFAAGYKTVHTNTSWEAETRTVGGTVFSSSYSGGTFTLYATRGGVTKRISSVYDGGAVISDGKTVYFTAKVSGKYMLYKASAAKGNAKKVGKLASSSHYGVTLSGLYKNIIYYVMDSPEGSFYRFSLKSKKAKKIGTSGTTVTNAEQNGKYFVLSDGTGAGYSYLGVYNAAKGKFRKIANLPKEPVNWHVTKKYVYFAEVINGHSYNPPYRVRIRRYTFSSGKTKTLVKSLKVKYVNSFSSDGVTYTTPSGTTKVKKW